MPRFCLALSLAVALSVVPARAADLLQIYRDALANDAAYASARAARDAGLENLPQGLAQILPTVNATAFTQYNDIAIGISVSSGHLERIHRDAHAASLQLAEHSGVQGGRIQGGTGRSHIRPSDPGPDRAGRASLFRRSRLTGQPGIHPRAEGGHFRATRPGKTQF